MEIPQCDRIGTPIPNTSQKTYISRSLLSKFTTVDDDNRHKNLPEHNLLPGTDEHSYFYSSLLELKATKIKMFETTNTSQRVEWKYVVQNFGIKTKNNWTNYW